MFRGENNTRVVHRPLPTLSDPSHLVLDNDRFGSAGRSNVVELAPLLTLLPLGEGNAYGVGLYTKERNQKIPQLSFNQPISLLNDGAKTSVLIAFSLTTDTGFLIAKEAVNKI